MRVKQRPVQLTPEAEGEVNRIPVYLHAVDLISRAGLTSQLRPRPEIRLVDEEDLATARVGVVVSDAVTEETLRSLRSLRSRGVQRLVLVTTHIDDTGLVNAVETGMAGLVRRAEASADRLIAVIQSAAAGDGSVPPDLLGRLLNQVGQVQRSVLGPRGLTFCGLAEREIEVLRLVADGFDTAEIADKLCYSQRTIKNVLHDVTSRLHLRNRSHAVAYALRNGLI